MTFFYDLNKRLANLSQQQTLTEGAVAEASYSAKAARAGKDIGKPGKNFEKIAKGAAERYGSKAAGERVAGAVLNKLRHPKESMGMTDEGNEFSGELAKAKAQHKDTFNVDGKSYPVKEEGGMPMTAKQKSFAKLAPPKDKITFADKIAGAKQEVEEMLGDVAAEAMRNALGKKQMADEGFPTVAGARSELSKRKVGDVTHGAKHDTQEIPGGRRVTRRTDAQGYSVGSDTDDEGNVKSTEKRKAGRPKGPEKAPERVTGKAYKHKGERKVKEGSDYGQAQQIYSDLADIRAVAKQAQGGGQFPQGFASRLESALWAAMTLIKNQQGSGAQVREGEGEGSDMVKLAKVIASCKTQAQLDTARRMAQNFLKKHQTGDLAFYGDDMKRGMAVSKDIAKKRDEIGDVNEDGIMPGATDADAGEYGQEGDMAKDQIHTIVRHAKALEKILSNREDLPEWVQSKLAKVEGMMAAVDDYMETQHERGAEMSQGIDMEEESTNKRDNRAEKAGKRVTKDLEYDMKHKGKDDDKAEKAGKKVTKDIEYDEKKKEKKVDETTTSGSVATGGAAPKASKGGVQIGKGIYDSVNRDVERLIAESMSINVSMTNDDNGLHKNITVTATDDDAEILAQLLQRAGLGGGMTHDHSHEEPCPECGSTDCGCDESVAEAYGDTDATQNKPDWPTDTEYNDDAMQYSGGLNKPKTDVAGDGQTTVPVTAVHTQDEDDLRRLREMAGIKQQELKPWERTMKEEEAVEEGVVDTVKGVVKKGLEKLGHGSDEDMRKDLQKKMGLPPTGEKPKDDKKMQESLMREFSNFKI